MVENYSRHADLKINTADLSSQILPNFGVFSSCLREHPLIIFKVKAG